MEFMKDNMWAYANAVSTVCVSDDEVRRLSVVRSGGLLILSHPPVMRENASRIGTNGARKGYGKLCSGLWYREYDSWTSYVCGLC